MLVWIVQFLLIGAQAREAVISATGNPHIPKTCPASGCPGDCECAAQSIAPVLAQAAKMPIMPVQTEEFLGVERVKVASLELALYKFRQPYVLNKMQLPFKILPVPTLAGTDLEVIEVPFEQASNSWFPGYAWSILVCMKCEGTHIGWKFTPTTTGASAAPFYALIVEAATGTEEETAGRVGVGLDVQEVIRVVGRPLAALGLAGSLLSNAQ